mmetsp:Transcript_17210/g.21453  ORF Transcript_17210/g.21453 Transcript_17210/m.21453 type:complete len:125 (-) Transcript_17210:269-643(-)
MIHDDKHHAVEDGNNDVTIYDADTINDVMADGIIDTNTYGNANGNDVCHDDYDDMHNDAYGNDDDNDAVDSTIIFCVNFNVSRYSANYYYDVMKYCDGVSIAKYTGNVLLIAKNAAMDLHRQVY